MKNRIIRVLSFIVFLIRTLLAGGMHPKLKARAFDSIKSYYTKLGRFIVDETKSDFLNTSVSTAIGEVNKKLVESMGW